MCERTHRAALHIGVRTVEGILGHILNGTGLTTVSHAYVLLEVFDVVTIARVEEPMSEPQNVTGTHQRVVYRVGE